jgi:hypothetical protein
VYLRNNDTFGTIYNKSTSFGHDRDIAHVNIFLTNLTSLLENKVYPRLERHRICQTLFLHSCSKTYVFFSKRIIFIFKNHIPIGAFDREVALNASSSPCSPSGSLLRSRSLARNAHKMKAVYQSDRKLHDVGNISSDIHTLATLSPEPIHYPLSVSSQYRIQTFFT